MNGAVRIRVEGLMLERLIQRAVSEGARFRRVRRDGRRALLLDADPASAQILVSLCERFSLQYRILERRGMHAAWLRLRSRATLLVGVAVCVAVVGLFLSRVWMIDVELTGDRAESAPLNILEDALASLNVYPGMPKHEIDTALLERQLSAAAPDFSFVGVRLQGVRLLVEAAPAVSEPELYAIDSGRDLVALHDGVVLSINAASGVACVKPGDTVMRGQVLIRGEEQVTKEETRSIAALGSVIARTWYTGEASLPAASTRIVRTGRTSDSAELRLMQFAWPLLEGESYSEQELEVETLPIGGLLLPLEIVKTTACETQTVREDADPDVLRARLAALAFAEAGMRFTAARSGGEIADRWIEYSLDDENNLHARAVYEVHADIAGTRSALLQGG